MTDNRAINTIDLPVNQLVPNTEEIHFVEDTIHLSMTEDEFREAVRSQTIRAKEDADKLKIESRQEHNAKYYIGDQVDKASLPDDQEKWVENAIFRNIETMIPIATARTPEVGVTPAYKNEQTREYAGNVRRVMQTEWEVEQGMQKIVSRAIRNHQINFTAVLKVGWDFEEDRPWTEEIPATDIVVSRDKRFIGHYIKDQTLGDLLDKFPDKTQEILQHYGHTTSTAVTKKIRSSPVQYLEVWIDDLVGWTLGNIVLGYDENPHFDRKGQNEMMQDPNGQPVFDPMTGAAKTTTVKYNHFKHPKSPFIFLSYFNRGMHVYDDTTLIEQTIGLQNWVNKRKRQIGMNADSTNGHWASSGDYISKEEFAKIEGSVDEKIWLREGKPSEGIAKLTGQAMPDFVYNDLLDSRNSLNQIMGIENATLGAETNNKTLGQDVMQRQQNYGRVDGYVRDGIERLAQEWYEWMYHLYLVYRTDEKMIAIPDDYDFESENVCFSRSKIPLIQTKNGEVVTCPLVLRVKAGSTLPEDDMATYAKAKEMKDVLRPRDYFKMVGMPNPRELEKNLLMYQMDPMADYMDDPQMQQMIQQKQAKEAQAMQQQQQQQQVQGDQQFSQKLKLEEVKQQNKQLPAGESADKEPTPDGVSKALRSELQNAGIDPAQMMS